MFLENPIIFVFGNDKLSSKIINSLNIPSGVILVRDNSTNLRRIFNLLVKKSISIKFLIKTLYCQMKYDSPRFKRHCKSIKTNNDLIQIIKDKKPKYIILFRAGLIINKKIIDLKIPLINIHCASLNGFGGLGSIYRALKEKVYNQCATAHIVTERIDQGKILAEIPYSLCQNKSYFDNELIAYKAGGELLQKIFNKDIKII